MLRYMLDTDTSSYVMKPSKSAARKLEQVPVGDVCISVITRSELLYGIEVSPRKQQDQAALNSFLRYVEVLSFSDEAALEYAKVLSELRQAGAMIGANDLFIAAHARSLGLSLVTNHMREFGRVVNLLIENWAV